MTFPHLQAAGSAPELLTRLGQFIEWWYGPRRIDFGEPHETLSRTALPEPLRRFYAIAGRWPSGDPDVPFFYSGAGGHHLLPLDGVEVMGDGKLRFFMEYQGSWDGVTLPEGDDPPVWLIKPRRKYDAVRVMCDRLSTFLVTHVLMASVYEDFNYSFSSSSQELLQRFLATGEEMRLIWSAEDCRCPQYDGRVYLVGNALVTESGGSFRRMVTHDPALALTLRERQAQIEQEEQTIRPTLAPIDRHDPGFYAPEDGLEDRIVTVALLRYPNQSSWSNQARTLARELTDAEVGSLLDRYDRFRRNVVPSRFHPEESFASWLHHSWQTTWQETLGEIAYHAEDRGWASVARAALSSDHPARNLAFRELCRMAARGVRVGEFFAALRGAFHRLPREQRRCMVDTLLRQLGEGEKADTAFGRQVGSLWEDQDFDRIRDARYDDDDG